MTKRVAITGLGVVSPFGVSFQAFSDATFNGVSGIRSRSYQHYDLPVAAAVFDDDGEFGLAEVTGAPRVIKMAILAARGAIANAGLSIQSLSELGPAGTYMGVGNAPVDVICDQFPDLERTGYVGPYSLLRGLPSGVATYVALDSKLQGPCQCFTAACASSTLAIGQAYRAISRGDIKVALAGGAEAPLHPGVVASWKALRALAPVDTERVEASCRPFDSKRRGLVLGEGAVTLVLEDFETAICRGANILAEIIGFGESCDATHLTRPDRNGQIRCMEAALNGFDRTKISLVVAHGTGTPAGDTIEINAIEDVFGMRSDLAVVSNKGLIGHTLGASGAFNLVTAIMALSEQRQSGSWNINILDERIGFDVLANASREVDTQAALINCFAFGGINNSLVCVAPPARF